MPVLQHCQGINFSFIHFSSGRAASALNHSLNHCSSFSNAFLKESFVVQAVREVEAGRSQDQGQASLYRKNLFQNKSEGAGETVRALLFLQRTWVQFPASMWRLITICNPNSKGSKPLFCPLRAPDTCVVDIHTYRLNTYTHKII